MNKKEQVEKKIREVCPELMELSFGCEVISGAFSQKMVYQFYGADTSEHGGGQYSHHCIYKDKRGTYTGDHIEEIIGHPIQLSHVLIALHPNTPVISTRSGGGYAYWLFFNENRDNEVCYDLSKPFSEQTEEVYDFLFDLICK